MMQLHYSKWNKEQCQYWVGTILDLEQAAKQFKQFGVQGKMFKFLSIETLQEFMITKIHAMSIMEAFEELKKEQENLQ